MSHLLRRYSSFIFAALVYFSVVIYFSIDFPYWDDYSLLRYLSLLIGDHISFYEFLTIKHVDHYIIIPKLVSLAIVLLFGKLNFSVFAILGNLLLFILFYQLIKGIESDIGQRLGNFIKFILFILIFNFSNSETIFAGFYGLQVIGSNLIAIMVIGSASRKEIGKIELGVILFLVLVGIFNQANMILIPFLIISAFIIHRRWNDSLVALLFMIFLFLVLHSLNFFQNNLGSNTINLKQISNRVFFFFSFLGSSFGMYGGEKYVIINKIFFPLSIFVGACASIYFAYLTFTQAVKRYTFLYLIALFYFLSGLAGAWGRGGELPEYAMSSRYHQYSLVFLISLSTICYMENKERFKAVNANLILIFVGIFTLFNFSFLMLQIQRIKRIKTEVYMFPDKSEAKEILNTAKEMGIYD
ncbi:hypothetical protein [Leptospira sp. 'Mane']|uniref:hypothetical protein n=1 Tax=Leptospira sp. 'Mane' TaxID=3387407 RepID=UPI00398AC219